MNRVKSYSMAHAGEINPGVTTTVFTVPDGMVYILKSFYYIFYPGNGSDYINIKYGGSQGDYTLLYDIGNSTILRQLSNTTDIIMYPGDVLTYFKEQNAAGVSLSVFGFVWEEIPFESKKVRSNG